MPHAVFLLRRETTGRILDIDHLSIENNPPMTTLVGLFFSLISIFGFFKGSAKRAMRRIVIITFSMGLILGQVLFMYRHMPIETQEFVGFSGLVSGIILILAFQKGDNG